MKRLYQCCSPASGSGRPHASTPSREEGLCWGALALPQPLLHSLPASPSGPHTHQLTVVLRPLPLLFLSLEHCPDLHRALSLLLKSQLQSHLPRPGSVSSIILCPSPWLISLLAYLPRHNSCAWIFTCLSHGGSALISQVSRTPAQSLMHP